MQMLCGKCKVMGKEIIYKIIICTPNWSTYFQSYFFIDVCILFLTLCIYNAHSTFMGIYKAD